MSSAVPTQWKLPEELRMPPPRSVSRRAGLGCGIIGMRLFILPHTLIGICVLFFLIVEPFLVLGTTAIPATVTKLTSNTSRKGGTTYQAEFQFSPTEAPGAPLTATEPIDSSEFNALHTGSTILVHTSVIGTHRYTNISRSPAAYVRHRYGMWLWALFWNGILSIFLYVAWVVPICNRNLVRNGDAVKGTITSKKIVGGKPINYQISYDFTPINEYQSRQGKTTTTNKMLFDQVQESQEITVLYNPNRPKRNVAYEFGDYVVVK